jgi:hypothetical protein
VCWAMSLRGRAHASVAAVPAGADTGRHRSSGAITGRRRSIRIDAPGNMGSAGAAADRSLRPAVVGLVDNYQAVVQRHRAAVDRAAKYRTVVAECAPGDGGRASTVTEDGPAR